MKAIIITSMCFLLFGINLTAQIETDSVELVNLYNATNGEGWNNTWDLQTPVSDWYGVGIDNDRVKFLNLTGNNLVGHIPDLNLDELWTLSLGNNHLIDTIPDFTFLTNLRNLFLDDNTLTGSIPDFTAIPSLRIFYCSNNELQGNIPSFYNCTNLSTFVCGNNKLTGEIPELVHLEDLFLYNIFQNQLSGPFPDSFPATLEIINCFDNNLTGELPDFQEALGIRVFDCANNQLSGSIPNYQDLLSFEIFYCSDNNLSGEIPSFENLPSLDRFSCSDNNLSGEMPDLTGVPALGYFYCDGNFLSGTIPDYSYHLALTALHVHNNQLTGEIPDISEWLNLTSLFVQNNDLHGTIPTEAPQGFNQLKCSNNNISGCFPEYACQLWMFEAENNLLMPWLGDHEPYCLGESQTGAPCDDSNVETINDSINEDCECNDIPISSHLYLIQNSISISPNPVDNELQIKVELYSDFIVRISDVNGRTVYQKVNTKIIDMSNLNPGTYFVSIILENRKVNITKRIIVH
jgi:Leucine-rich repeat (LRR) protein